jgi:hypothetical protein
MPARRQPGRRWSRSPRVAVAAATVAFLAATGTHFALRGEAAPPVDPTPVDSGDPSGRFSASWWSSEDARCPAGASLRGAAPPDGREIWCARPDGARDGLHFGWHPNGQLAFERRYRDGVLDGPLTEWFASGQVERTGQHRAGVREGRWVRWSMTGEVAEVVFFDPTGARLPGR